jgi:flagellin-specific chaperone FliS
MFIAREKLKTNVVEYILYMFHIEDIIRSNFFKIDELEKNVIGKYQLSKDEINEVRAWYQYLIDRMEKEDIRETGHLSMLKELIFQLNDLHIQLLNTLEEERYIEYYRWAADYIKELKDKMKHEDLTEIEVCLNGLYGYMLLKMKGTPISDETSQAMSIFSQMLRYLSKKYHERLQM